MGARDSDPGVLPLQAFLTALEAIFFVIKTLLPPPGILFHQGLELGRAAIVCKDKGCTLGVEREGRCEDGAQLEQARVSGRRHS